MKSQLVILDVKNNKRIEISVEERSKLYITISNKDVMNIFEKPADKEILIPVIAHELDDVDTTFFVENVEEE